MKGLSWEEVPQPVLQAAESHRTRGTDVTEDRQTAFSLHTSGCNARFSAQCRWNGVLGTLLEGDGLQEESTPSAG